ncbi:MAG: hypothetical protein ACOCXM_02090 [Myxococcota bacterium]
MRRGMILWVCSMCVLVGCDSNEEAEPDMMGSPDAGEEVTCEKGDPVIDDLSGLDPCPESICPGGGRCMSNDLVPEGSSDLLAPCSDTRTCVPEEFVRYAGETVPDSCTSLGGAEGRCISVCVPEVGDQADVLPQDVCDEFELCAPCYDPRTGEETSACSLSCDMPTEPKLTFDTCCEDIGSCVPTDLIPEDFQDQLPMEDCDEGTLCAPDVFVEDIDHQPPPCTAAIGGEEVGEGVCLAKCVVAANSSPEEADLLDQASCGDGEVCAPCEDPTSGESTGACDL